MSVKAASMYAYIGVDMRDLDKGATIAERRMQDVGKKAEQTLGKGMQAAQGASDALGLEMVRLSQKLALAGDKSESAALKYRMFSGDLRTADPAIKASAMNLAALADKQDRILKTLDVLPQKARNLGRNLTLGVTAPLIAGGVLAVKTAMDLEQSVANIKSIKPEIDTSKLFRELNQMQTRVPYAAKQLSGELYDIFSSVDISVGDGTKLLEKFTRGATGAMTDVQTWGTGVMGVMNAYQKKLEDVDHIQDLVFNTVKYGVVTGPQLAENMGFATGFAKQAGASPEELFAAIAAGTKEGGAPAQNINNIANMFQKIYGPEAIKGWNALKIKVQDANGNFKPFAVNVEALKNKLDQLDPYTRKQFLAKMLPDMQATTGLTVLMHEMDFFKKVLDENQKSVGATDQAYKTMSATGANAATIFKNTLNKELGDLGMEILPEVTDALRWGTKFLHDLSPEAKEAAIKIALVAAAAGPGIGLAGTLVGALRDGTQFLKLLSDWRLAAIAAKDAQIGLNGATAISGLASLGGGAGRLAAGGAGKLLAGGATATAGMDLTGFAALMGGGEAAAGGSVAAGAVGVGLASNPVGWAVAAAAIIAALIYRVNELDNAEDNLKKTYDDINKQGLVGYNQSLRDAITLHATNATKAQDLLAEYKKLKSQGFDKTTEGSHNLQAVLNDIAKLNPDLVTGFDHLGNAIGLVADAQDRLNQSIKDGKSLTKFDEYMSRMDQMSGLKKQAGDLQEKMAFAVSMANKPTATAIAKNPLLADTSQFAVGGDFAPPTDDETRKRLGLPDLKSPGDWAQLARDLQDSVSQLNKQLQDLQDVGKNINRGVDSATEDARMRAEMGGKAYDKALGKGKDQQTTDDANSLINGGRGGKNSMAAIIKDMAAQVDTPEGNASCAIFASKILEGLGKNLPKDFASAGELAKYVAAHGGKEISASAAKAGDLLVWHGKQYGAIKDTQGQGYHVGISLGGGQMVDDLHRQGRAMFDKQHAVAYRMPSDFKATSEETATGKARDLVLQYNQAILDLGDSTTVAALKQRLETAALKDAAPAAKQAALASLEHYLALKKESDATKQHQTAMEGYRKHLLELSATSDEDRLSIERYGKTFAQLTSEANNAAAARIAFQAAITVTGVPIQLPKTTAEKRVGDIVSEIDKKHVDDYATVVDHAKKVIDDLRVSTNDLGDATRRAAIDAVGGEKEWNKLGATWQSQVLSAIKMRDGIQAIIDKTKELRDQHEAAGQEKWSEVQKAQAAIAKAGIDQMQASAFPQIRALGQLMKDALLGAAGDVDTDHQNRALDDQLKQISIRYLEIGGNTREARIQQTLLNGEIKDYAAAAKVVDAQMGVEAFDAYSNHLKDLRTRLLDLSSSSREARIELLMMQEPLLSKDQAKTIVNFELDVDKYASEMQMIRDLGDSTADFLAKSFGSLFTEKFPQWFGNTIQGFDQMLIQIANDYVKSLLRTLIENTLISAFGPKAPTGPKQLLDVSVHGKADGGPVMAGVPYIVGERGPELRTFDHPGFIVPNHELAAAGGKGGGSPIFNIAIDVHAQDHQSFKANEQAMYQDALEKAFDAWNRNG